MCGESFVLFKDNGSISKCKDCKDLGVEGGFFIFLSVYRMLEIVDEVVGMDVKW